MLAPHGDSRIVARILITTDETAFYDNRPLFATMRARNDETIVIVD